MQQSSILSIVLLICLLGSSAEAIENEVWSPPRDTGGYHEVYLQIDNSGMVIRSGIDRNIILVLLGFDNLVIAGLGVLRLPVGVNLPIGQKHGIL